MWNAVVMSTTTSYAAVRIVTLSKTSALYRICSSMAASLSTAEDFSPLDSLTSILRKLATKEFASEILPRHRVIRQQIEALLQSTAELQSLCAVLSTQAVDSSIDYLNYSTGIGIMKYCILCGVATTRDLCIN